ncbi:MAG: endonuclease III domain-containing protein [Candidatus Altiarchaeota archaeon]
MTRTNTRNRLEETYSRLYESFGPQGWWPAEDRFEVIVGAILTQSTSWSNVEKAIGSMRDDRVLSPEGIRKADSVRLSGLIRSSLYHNAKARKLKAFVEFMDREYGGSMEAMMREDAGSLRPRLLSVWGVGPETADSIMLYALDMPSFVVDAYTRRIFSRLGLFSDDADYGFMKRFFEDNMDRDVGLYKEYHALIVELGKRFCRKSRPLCGGCPLHDGCGFMEEPAYTRA